MKTVEGVYRRSPFSVDERAHAQASCARESRMPIE